MANASDVTNMALFCDFENIALGVRDADYEKFDIGKVLERLLLKGSIVVKKAYCDWDRYKAFKAPMHEASFELIEIPHVRQSGKNSADIRMVVDALDLCYTKSHVDTFVIISGDSDFSPLVSKLRENAKTVIGVGVKNSTSDLLIANCDEFIFYDDLVREQKKRAARKSPARIAEAKGGEAKAGDAKVADGKAADGKMTEPKPAGGNGAKRPARGRGKAKAEAAAPAAVPTPSLAELYPDAPEASLPPHSPPKSDDEKLAEALDLVTGTIEALAAERGGDEKIWGSMVKQALKRVRPGFNESYYGFRSFNALLEEAQARGLVRLERDEKSGGYAVRMGDRVACSAAGARPAPRRGHFRAPRSELLVAAQVAPLPHRQRSQRHAAAAHALQPGHREADQLAHAADLALAALAQHEPELVLVLPRHARGLQLDAVELEAVLQQLHALVGQRALDAHQVLLLDRRVAADQVLGDAAVLREHDEPGRVDVQSPGGGEAAQVTRLEPGRRRILGPAVLRLDQHHRRLVAVLGLRRDVADRLVEQDRHLLALVLRRGRVDLDARVRRHAHAERGDDLAVDPDPAVLDPLVGLAPRAQAEFAHALGQAGVVGVFVARGARGRRRRR